MIGKPLLAVRDYSGPVVSAQATGLPYQRLGIDPQTPYLNSGVLVMDISSMASGELRRGGVSLHY